MSSKFIVRQPIKNAAGTILGYEILYHGENQPFDGETAAERETAAADTLSSFLTNGSRAFKGALHFMTFTPKLLAEQTPRLFDQGELVIQLDDNVVIHPRSMEFVTALTQEGYRIAVNEFQFAPRYLALLDSIDYLKVNILTAPISVLRNLIEIAHSTGKQCIVTNIETREQYDLALALEADAMQGSYVAEKLTTKAHSSSYLRSNFFRLMVAVTQDEPDVDEVEQLISMDAGLSYGLLKLANSAYFALRNRATTIHQAIMTLGLGQLRQWVYLLSVSSMEQESEGATEEFLKLSLLRANFCRELMQYAKEVPISKTEAYLLGMFSTLNHLVDAPMADILKDIPVAEPIKEALLTGKGRCGLLYQLVLSYEKGDWDHIHPLAEQLSISEEVLTGVYFTCMESVNALWMQLTHVSPKQ